MPQDSSQNLPLFLEAMAALGWTVVDIRNGGPEAEAMAWLNTHAGEECDWNNWDPAMVVGHCEHLGGWEFLIRDPQVALLFKLTWA